MATEEPKTDLGEDGEDGDAEEGDKDKYNPELLAACMRNDTEDALALIEKGADFTCEDSRQWSPLIWAASHGNETLTRHLIKIGAADVYKYDTAEGKVVKKKKTQSPSLGCFQRSPEGTVAPARAESVAP